MSRAQRSGAVIAFEGLMRAPQTEQNAAATVERLGVVRSEPDRLLDLEQGFVEPTQLHQHDAPIGQNAGMGRNLRLRLHVGRERLVQSIEFLEHGSVVVQYAGMTGQQSQRLLIVLSCLFIAALPQRRIALLDEFLCAAHGLAARRCTAAGAGAPGW
jgi:hypothetical protein